MTCHILKQGSPLCGQPLGRDNWVPFDEKKTLRRASCWRCICVHVGHAIPVVPPLPEHEKLKEAKLIDDATQFLGEFLEGMTAAGIVLARHHDAQWICQECGPLTSEQVQHPREGLRGNARLDDGPEYVHRYCEKPIAYSPEGLYRCDERVEQLLASFFKINMDALEDEKRALLEHIRAEREAALWAESEGKKLLRLA